MSKQVDTGTMSRGYDIATYPFVGASETWYETFFNINLS